MSIVELCPGVRANVVTRRGNMTVLRQEGIRFRDFDGYSVSGSQKRVAVMIEMPGGEKRVWPNVSTKTIETLQSLPNAVSGFASGHISTDRNQWENLGGCGSIPGFWFSAQVDFDGTGRFNEFNAEYPSYAALLAGNDDAVAKILTHCSGAYSAQSFEAYRPNHPPASKPDVLSPARESLFERLTQTVRANLGPVLAAYLDRENEGNPKYAFES